MCCVLASTMGGSKRHRRHRVNLLRRSSAILADETPPSVTMRFIVSRWVHLAMPDPTLERNTPRMHMVSCSNRSGWRTTKASMKSTARVLPSGRSVGVASNGWSLQYGDFDPLATLFGCTESASEVIWN